jgi:hypothetical protein
VFDTVFDGCANLTWRHLACDRGWPGLAERSADTAWMPRSCRWNDMDAAFMSYDLVQVVPK